MDIAGLSERRIQAALEEGAFDNLAGAGEPLPTPPDGDAVEQAGFRLMAENGAVPREVELMKAVVAQRAVLAATTDPEARKREMAVLAQVRLRLDLEAKGRRRAARFG